MKYILFTTLLLLAANPLFAQMTGLWIPESAKVNAYSVEGHHRAECPLDSASINFKKKGLYCRIAVKEFNFGALPVFARKISVVQRFLSAYMEVERYPYITYEGTITRMVNRSDGTTDTLWTTGQLTAHGVTRKVTFPVAVVHKDGLAVMQGQFDVKAVDDYKIKANTPIRQRYLNHIRISFAARMKPSQP